MHDTFPQPTCCCLLLIPKQKSNLIQTSNLCLRLFQDDFPQSGRCLCSLPRLFSCLASPLQQLFHLIRNFNWVLLIECQNLLVLLCWLSRAPPSWESPPCFSPDVVSSHDLPVSSPDPRAFSLRSTLSLSALSSFFALPPEIDKR